MTNSLQIAPDDEVPLRGARRLALEAYGSNEESDIKRLYNEAPFLPVFRLKPKGPLMGYASQLRIGPGARAQAQAVTRAAGAEVIKPVTQRAERQSQSRTNARAIDAPQSQQNNGDWLRPPPRPGADQFFCGGNRDRRSRTFSEE